MSGILDLIGALVSFALRVGIVIISTPVVLAWPRADTTNGYWHCVRNRYVRVLKFALF